MAGEIQNKIQSAGLVVLDVSSIQAKGLRIELDFAIFLDESPVVIEAVFKKKIQSFNWEKYRDSFVAITCSKDIIIPPWAYLLIQVKLLNIAKEVFFCSLKSMELLLFQKELENLNLKEFDNKTVFLKV